VRHDLVPYVRMMHPDLMAFLAKDRVEAWYQEADRDRRLRDAGLLGALLLARLVRERWRRARSSRPGDPDARTRAMGRTPDFVAGAPLVAFSSFSQSTYKEVLMSGADPATPRENGGQP
jgi:hypothetical protein